MPSFFRKLLQFNGRKQMKNLMSRKNLKKLLFYTIVLENNLIRKKELDYVKHLEMLLKIENSHWLQ